MPQRNFYVVLGIPPDASPEMIRSAYRTLAKAYHPDRIGPSGMAQFQAISQAYSVLSEAQRRGAQNKELRFRAADERSVAEPPGPHPVRAEPLMAEPIAIRHSFHISHPSIEEEFLNWTMRYSTDSHIPKSGHQHDAEVEVILSTDEAEIGGVLPIQVPSFRVCALCGGTGRDWSSFCLMCDGAGVVEGRRTIRLHIPEMVPDGTFWEIAVPEGGLQLRIRIRVDPYSP